MSTITKKGNNMTVAVPFATVMRRKWFRQGWDDYKAGLGFHADYEKIDRADQGTYERGRQLAACFPDATGFKQGNHIAPGNVRAYANLRKTGVIR